MQISTSGEVFTVCAGAGRGQCCRFCQQLRQYYSHHSMQAATNQVHTKTIAGNLARCPHGSKHAEELKSLGYLGMDNIIMRPLA